MDLQLSDLQHSELTQYVFLLMSQAPLHHRFPFAIEGEGEAERVQGTCAVLKVGDGRFEIAKMAVKPEARGKGCGDRLMQAAIDWVRERKEREILILSNTILEPAIRLYRKFGFEVVHLGPHPDYERCNIEMRLKRTDC